MKKKILLMVALVNATMAWADGTDFIRLNQVGYYPQQEKVVVVDQVKPKKAEVFDAQGHRVAKGKVVRSAVSPFTGKTRYIVDFSQVKTEGNYTVKVDGQSMPFIVKSHALADITKGAMESYYLMRSGTVIDQAYAGRFARPLGHPDTMVMVHPTAATSMRPPGTVISSPLGWYDAGDYNKYIVNSAFSIGLMLAVYQQQPDYFARLQLRIPERGNKTPDFLDEIMFNLKWMLTMQDPDDGGVYHKLTTPSFEGFVMPIACKQQRYVVQKSVTAALDFAAVMAQAAGIYAPFADYADFSQKALAAAEKAYLWAKKNPKAFYRQGLNSRWYKPEVSTGEYGDGRVEDELFWAATQLYIATNKTSYLEDARSCMPERFVRPVWGEVSGLGVYAWLQTASGPLREKCLSMLKEFADKIVGNTAKSNFMSPFGDQPSDFGWGCLAENFCSPAIALLYADNYVAKGKYRKDALRAADYVLGRNATGFCYVTGYGVKSPRHPHQRISEADGIDDPMPGLLVGGPNPGQQDLASGINYPSKAPDESYADVMASYASNEIAINWNASLVGLLSWLDAIF
jgi:endoglucanase